MPARRARTLLFSAVNVVRQRPILAIFDVTKRCNQRCPMCNIPNNSCEELSLAEIKTLAAALRKFGVGYVFLQGGEPLIRKDVTQIADAFIAEGIKPTVITNGVLLNRETAQALARRRCNVAISLDSLDAQRYRKLRGTDDMDVVVQNIREASKIKKRGGNWAITTTISKQSALEDVKSISELADETGFMFAIRPYISVNGVAGRFCEELSYEESDIIGIFRCFSQKARRENYFAHLIYEYHIKYIEKQPMPMCDALKYSFFVRENGQIAPCIEWPDQSVTTQRFAAAKKELVPLLCRCNREHPCFYNDAREIGILIRSIPKIMVHLPVILKQTARYGSFF